MSRAPHLRRVAAAAFAVLLLAGCSDGGGANANPVSTPSASPTPSPSPTPSQTGPPTPGQEFSAEVEELYALVQRSVAGSGDLAANSQVLDAYATTIALVRVPDELADARQGVVDAAEAAAEAYRTAGGITGALERAAAVAHAGALLRELERVIDALPA